MSAPTPTATTTAAAAPTTATATTANPLPAPVPRPDPDSAGFWSALNDGRLAVARCTRCRTWQQPPTETCRHCAGPVAFEPVSGQGTIYSFIVIRQATVPGHQVPYAVALVELAEQADIRITGVVRVPLDEIRVGLPVKADVVAVGDGGQSVVEFITA
ncbi:OB-fold domain-containing protein [Frankia sp. AiPs1]|uniref:Zn-ribbon domain-containing OB-fold protein n=1 Tax=Frankia sp. AiPs1 TaxID=573493 RepID=UPI00204484DD|nr:OB-fold domain-containing protein [Frankia sp. AiPs1]MCM3920855.1 OB-fold domain-containing protein [Frankia sp. AiPs1]